MSFGASKQQSQSKTASQEEWLNQALELYGPQLGQGENIFQGDTVAPFTDVQKNILDQSGDFLQEFAPGTELPLIGETGQALGGALTGTTGAQPISSEQTADFFNQAIRDPAYYNFQEGVRPLIQEEFSGPGYWSSARAGAVTKAGQDLSKDLTSRRAQLEWDTALRNQAIEEGKAGRSLQAVPLASQFAGLPTSLAQQKLQGQQDVFAFAGQEQAQEQANINAAIQKFAQENQLTSMQDMEILMGLLGLDFGKSSGKSFNIGLT